MNLSCITQYRTIHRDRRQRRFYHLSSLMEWGVLGLINNRQDWGSAPSSIHLHWHINDAVSSRCIQWCCCCCWFKNEEEKTPTVKSMWVVLLGFCSVGLALMRDGSASRPRCNNVFVSLPEVLTVIDSSRQCGDSLAGSIRSARGKLLRNSVSPRAIKHTHHNIPEKS